MMEGLVNLTQNVTLGTTAGLFMKMVGLISAQTERSALPRLALILSVVTILLGGVLRPVSRRSVMMIKDFLA